MTDPRSAAAPAAARADVLAQLLDTEQHLRRLANDADQLRAATATLDMARTSVTQAADAAAVSAHGVAQLSGELTRTAEQLRSTAEQLNLFDPRTLTAAAARQARRLNAALALSGLSAVFAAIAALR